MVAALYVETNGVYYGLPDALAIRTPPAFRDVLLDMARSALPQTHPREG